MHRARADLGWGAALLIAGFGGVGCADEVVAGPSDDGRVDNSDETVLCIGTVDAEDLFGGEALSVGEEAHVVLWVRSGGCISVAGAICTATQTGDRVEVHSEIEWIDSGESTCTLALKHEAVRCEGTLTLGEGVVTLVHGQESLEISVPGSSPNCP